MVLAHPTVVWFLFSLEIRQLAVYLFHAPHLHVRLWVYLVPSYFIVSEAEAKVSRLLQDCSIDKLRERHGDVVDWTPPYFEAMTKLHAATKLARVKADL